MLLLFLGGAGCAGPAPLGRNAAVAPPSVVAAPPPQPPAAEPPSSQAADRAYEAQLSLERGGQFDAFRQVTELKHAIFLYGQFLERAEGRPELLPAVRRARERLADAQDTLIFLEQAPASGD